MKKWFYFASNLDSKEANDVLNPNAIKYLQTLRPKIRDVEKEGKMIISSKFRKCLYLVFITLSFIVPTANSTDFFAPYVSYPTGSKLDSHLTTGDFNGDGILDIVTANYGNNTISVLIGNGDGSFQVNKDYPVDHPWAIVNTDFDGDGKLDIAVTTFLNNTLLVLTGNGDGTFRLKQSIGTGSLATDIATGDFNGDKKVDFAAITNFYTGTISIFIGNGDGTFQSKKDVETGNPPIAITTGDFDSDGKTDLATTSHSSYISVLIGNGDGTFRPKKDYYAGNDIATWDIIGGDFNNDGKLDLAATNIYNQSVSVFIGNGDGTFQSARFYGAGSQSNIYAITVGDFNSDGKLDIVTANYQENSVSLLVGNGDGTFQPRRDYVTDYRPMDVIAGDFNGDGQLDIATANVVFTSSVSVLLNIYNRQPIANAGPDQIAACGSPSGTSVILNGAGSSDPDGDTITYKWTWPGGLAEGVNPTVTLPLGTTTVTLTVSDGKATVTDTVNITLGDTTPPLTTATGNSEEWHNTNLVLTFSGSDSCSGVKEIHYSIDGAETVVPGNYAAVTIIAEGVHNVTYYAVDKAGNTESPKRMAARIDKIPPVITVLSPVAGDYLISDVLTLDYSAVDATSGIASVAATLDGQPAFDGQALTLYALIPGSHALVVSSIDNAGNQAAKSVTFNIIVTADSISKIIDILLNTGQIDNAGVANSLIQQLNNGDIKAFLNHIDAQEGKHISIYAASLLRTAVSYLN